MNVNNVNEIMYDIPTPKWMLDFCLLPLKMVNNLD